MPVWVGTVGFIIDPLTIIGCGGEKENSFGSLHRSVIGGGGGERMAGWLDDVGHAGGECARACDGIIRPLEHQVPLVPHTVSERLPGCVYERALDIVRKEGETKPPGWKCGQWRDGQETRMGESNWRNTQDQGGAVLLLKRSLFGTVLSLSP